MPTSTTPAPSREIGRKISSIKSEKLNGGKLTPGGTANSAFGSCRSIAARVRVPASITAMAVPGSLTAGDSAREAISESTTSLAREEAGRRLVHDIEQRGGTLSTGFLGTPHILDALADSGQQTAAISLLLQRKWPSWGYMVEKGATTMWERWNSDRGDVSMNSFNHYAFGAIGSFLFRPIAGLDAREPGFKSIDFSPIYDQRLGGVAATFRSVSGTIHTSWNFAKSGIEIRLTLPTGVRAYLPATVEASGAHRVLRGKQRINLPLT